jgi:L-iditol 2-dehydrogenase
LKALVLSDVNHLDYQDVPDPEAGPGEVVVAVRACGICGSDVHGMGGGTGRRQPPVIMGHEASGVIAEVGDGVSGWAEGDRVTFDSTLWCGECRFCRAGRVNLCDHRRVLGVSCDEYRQDGAFAERVAVPARVLYRVPEGLSFEQAAMVEPLSVAVHAVNRTDIELGDTAVVIGAGIIGQLLIQALRAAGCGTIIASDPDTERAELARTMRADVALCPGADDVVEEVLRRTGGGADIVVEAVGLPETLDTAAACVRKGGQVTLVGNLAAAADLPLQDVVTREVRLHGSCASAGEYAACLEMLERGAVRVEPLISAVAPLEEGAEWFSRLSRRQAGVMKVLLRP